MRQAHQASLQALPAQTLARLRAARHSAGHARTAPRRGWLLAAAAPAVLGAVFGVHLLLGPAPSPAPPATHIANASVVTAPSAGIAARDDGDDASVDLLDENPDLYLWLGSDTSLAME
ncbi:hypothetical protein [Xanthomonas medicagonis]|uniref:hypothetical protein n=1 Tax=Xanthomonas medicagonis TaxID=3160841 RepID=UPI0035183785